MPNKKYQDATRGRKIGVFLTLSSIYLQIFLACNGSKMGAKERESVHHPELPQKKTENAEVVEGKRMVL